MVTPSLLAWMVERHHITTYRLTSLSLVVLVIVAPLTSQSQVIERRFSALTSGNDMFNRKRLNSKTSLASAILATSIGTFSNSLFQLSRDTTLRHTLAFECLNFSSMQSGKFQVDAPVPPSIPYVALADFLSVQSSAVIRYAPQV